MTDTPISERKRITFIGRRNAGKSSLINSVTQQQTAIVSHVPGTTTDPVSKTMELFPLGPVVVTDTAGYDDDDNELGSLRIGKTKEVLSKTDIVVLVIASDTSDLDREKEIISNLITRSIPYVICITKADLEEAGTKYITESLIGDKYTVSNITGEGIEELRTALGKIGINKNDDISVLDGLCSPGDVVLLVTPIDSSAPKGRMILPQVMVIRDIVEKHAVCICVQPDEYPKSLKQYSPNLVITDSQVFDRLKQHTPSDTKMTSFSILMARMKGNLPLFVKGAEAIDFLTDGDIVLIAEACTHHVQKNDIGSFQIPDKLKKYTGKKLVFEKASGQSFPDDLTKYSLIIHCGGCMISRTHMMNRQKLAENSNIPMTNYGIALAKLAGILDKAASWIQ